MEIKGIIKDPEETERINKSFLDCKNILLDKGFTSIINEKGFEEKVLFSESERILGIVPTNKYIIVFVYISDALRIYKVDESFTKTNILTTEYLNCTGNYLIQGLFKQNYKGDTIVVFWEDNYEDCINPCIVNIDDIGVDLTTNKELVDPVKIERLKLFPNQKVPNLEVLDKISGGNIQTGNYQIAIAYELDGERLNYLNITNPFTISNTSYQNGTHVNGYPSISMFCSILPNTSYTNYAVPIKITNIDTNFDNIVISVIQKTNDITTCKLLGKVKISSNEYTYVFKGDDEFTVTQSLEEITVDNLNINKFRSGTSFNGRLYISNFNIENKIDFQKYANNIKIGLNWINVMDSDIPSKYYGVVRYDKTDYETKYKTFRPGEVYAFYIHLILNNGYITDGYHIPGSLSTVNLDYPIVSDSLDLNGKSHNKITTNLYQYNTIGQWINDNNLPNDRYYKTNNYLPAFINDNESYNTYFKDTELEIHNNTGNIGTLNNLNVRHHTFPNSVQDMAGVLESNNSLYYAPIAFGISIEDVYIPDNIKSQIQGYFISYAERNSTNSLVAFSGLKCEDMNVMYQEDEFSTYGHYPLDIPAIADNSRKPMNGGYEGSWVEYKSKIPGTRIYDYSCLFNKFIPNFIYDYEIFNINFTRNLTYLTVEPSSNLLFYSRFTEEPNSLSYIQRSLNFIKNDSPIIVPIDSTLDNYYNKLRELYIAVYQYTEKGINNNPISKEIKIDIGEPYGQLKYNMDNIYPILAMLNDNRYTDIINMSIRNFKRILSDCYLNFKNQTLVRCSNNIDKNITTIPFIMNGDTYINKELSRQRIAKFEGSSEYTDYNVIDIAYTNYSSMSNVHQTDDYIVNIPQYYSDQGADPQLFPKYENNNITYSTKAKLKIPKPNDNELYTNEFKYSIIRSIAQGNETLIEKWRTFKDTDLHTFFTNKGELEYINTNDRIMYIHYHNSLYKAVIKDTIDSNSVSVGIIQGEIFDRIPEEIQSGDNTFIFSRYINQSLFTKYGYFHIDIDNNKIYLLSDSVKDLTKFKITNDIKNDFTIVLNKIKQGDKSLVFSSINFDEENDRVLFNYNFHNGNKSQCLSYYPIIDSFVSKHDYKASKLFSFLNKSYCISNNAIIGNNLGTQNNGIYKLNSGIYGKYCDANIIYNSYIIFLLKSKNSIDEIFESIKYNKNKDNNFDNCIVFSKDQCSDNININVSGDWYDMSSGRTLLDEHIINNFRDIATNSNFINTNEDYILITNGINNNLDWYDKSEFIGKFVYCKLLHDNTKNKEIKLTNIDYNTKIFYR